MMIRAKRIKALLLTSVVALCLTACQSSESTVSTETTFSDKTIQDEIAQKIEMEKDSIQKASISLQNLSYNAETQEITFDIFWTVPKEGPCFSFLCWAYQNSQEDPILETNFAINEDFVNYCDSPIDSNMPEGKTLEDLKTSGTQPITIKCLNTEDTVVFDITHFPLNNSTQSIYYSSKFYLEINENNEVYLVNQ